MAQSPRVSLAAKGYGYVPEAVFYRTIYFQWAIYIL